jgi:hypothetical protein
MTPPDKLPEAAFPRESSVAQFFFVSNSALKHWVTFAKRMITDAQRKHYETAGAFLLSRRDKREKSVDKTWPLNRGDLMFLVALIDLIKGVRAY